MPTNILDLGLKKSILTAVRLYSFYSTRNVEMERMITLPFPSKGSLVLMTMELRLESVLVFDQGVLRCVLFIINIRGHSELRSREVIRGPVTNEPPPITIKFMKRPLLEMNQEKLRTFYFSSFQQLNKHKINVFEFSKHNWGMYCAISHGYLHAVAKTPAVGGAPCSWTLNGSEKRDWVSWW